MVGQGRADKHIGKTEQGLARARVRQGRVGKCMARGAGHIGSRAG